MNGTAVMTNPSAAEAINREPESIEGPADKWTASDLGIIVT